MEGVHQAEDSESVHRLPPSPRGACGACCLCLPHVCPTKTVKHWRTQFRRLAQRALGEARDTDMQVTCVQHIFRS